VKTLGDGFMASFTTASAAVDCAIWIERALAQRPGEPISVRIGINAGEPIEEEMTCLGRRSSLPAASQVQRTVVRSS
jgi:class 3 adenylate cyclase